MNTEELIKLIEEIQKNKCESNVLELKKDQKECPKKLYDTLSSFSNQNQGGVIVFGIDEEHDYALTGVEDPQKIQKSINEKCKEMEPCVRPFLTTAKIQDQAVVAAEIPPVEFSLRPVFYKPKGRLKGSYIRVGDSDEPMTEAEIYAYEAFRKNIQDDLQTVSGPLLYPDESLLKHYLERYRENRPNTSQHLTDNEILNFSGIYLDNQPTLAGMLVFSKAPQVFFPEFSIIGLVVPGTEIGDLDSQGARFTENVRIEGSISQMLKEAVSFISRNTRTKTVIDSAGRRRDIQEYPPRAIREAILNALIHRDYGRYSREFSVRITVFYDRLEIRSPGGIFGNAGVEQLGHQPIESRNGRLIRILEDLSITEHRFSGIPTIYKECQAAGLPTPEFINRHGEFIVIFRPESTAVRIQTEDFEPVSKNPDSVSMEEKILRFCTIPRSRSELSEHFEIKWDSINRNYIRKLIAEKKIELTRPDSPRARNQKYRTVSD